MTSRVLVVDDDEIVSGAVFQQLVASGVRTDLATSPLDAERLLRAGSYSLVLMDAFLTGHLSDRATALVDRVRALSPDAYVIVLTQYGSERLARHLARYDRLTIVAKPKPVAFITELIEGLL